MARQAINLGALPQGVGGDTPRSANTKVNDMTSELYTALGAPSTTGALPSALPVLNGGTGAATASAARSNLGVDVTLASAVLDPQSAGGLMSSIVVSGWTIEKFLNGTLIMTGSTTSTSLPASQISTHTFAVPSGIIAADGASLMVNMLPRAANDCSINYNYMGGPTSGAIIVRNGTVAQIFDFRIKIVARWKV